MKIAEDKLAKLIKDKEKELDVLILETVEDNDQNIHILGKRKKHPSYIVWSSYNTGEAKTSHTGFYNGTYDLTLSQGVDELKRRAHRDII